SRRRSAWLRGADEPPPLGLCLRLDYFQQFDKQQASSGPKEMLLQGIRLSQYHAQQNRAIDIDDHPRRGRSSSKSANTSIGKFAGGGSGTRFGGGAPAAGLRTCRPAP